MYVKASENHGKVANYVKGCAKNQSKIIYKLWTEQIFLQISVRKIHLKPYQHPDKKRNHSAKECPETKSKTV